MMLELSATIFILFSKYNIGNCHNVKPKTIGKNENINDLSKSFLLLKENEFKKLSKIIKKKFP